MIKNVVLFVASTALLVACGVKPKEVSAPEGTDQTAFPKVYPNTKTDPKPEDE